MAGFSLGANVALHAAAASAAIAGVASVAGFTPYRTEVRGGVRAWVSVGVRVRARVGVGVGVGLRLRVHDLGVGGAQAFGLVRLERLEEG